MGKAHTIEALNAVALVDTFVVNDFIVKIHANTSKLDKKYRILGVINHLK